MPVCEAAARAPAVECPAFSPGFRAALPQRTNETRDGIGWGHDDRKVRRARQTRHLWVNRHSVEGLMMPVDQQQLAAEIGAAQVAQDDRTDRAGTIGGAD